MQAFHYAPLYVPWYTEYSCYLGESWRKAVLRDVNAVSENPGKLFSCPKIKIKLVEAITLQDGIHNIPK